jgi:anti-sigma regulatory factor (Ser/Thr protein kinase)
MDAGMNVGITLTIEESKLQVSVMDQGKGVGEISSPKIVIKIAC